MDKFRVSAFRFEFYEGSRGGCLFDNEDTRIHNNVFYCSKHF